MSAEQNLAKLNVELPVIPKPKAIYKPCLIDGKYLYVSGHVPINPDGSRIQGKVGADMDADSARKVARHVGMCILASIKNQLGSLDKVKRVIKILGMVNAVPDFTLHPHVINGCSELFVEIWGEDNGVGVRSAVGMGSLPDGIPVEIEGLFELHD
ncbi:RidA family protein [Pollutibacter soli]|uniref:RidA family protein n=1 Tax=Pollutibacter soli TaxID=3034157 RepID=UPI00301320A2